MSSPSLESVRQGPLIGRAGELEIISKARAAGSRGVVVRAPAGVGKSRLARAALEGAAEEGASTAWVQATRSAASVPLGAFAGVIPADVRSDDMFELLRRSARAMVDLAGARALVLGVDDAQLLDPTSAALVLHLASTAAAFVVATVRSGEPCPDAVVSIWKDVGAERLDLTVLGERETEQLVESIVGGHVQESVRRWIWETSQGNALYARELVLGALASESLQLVGGIWRMAGPPPISRSLAELISARLAGVAEAEHRVLELLALGEPLRLSEIVELVGTDVVAACEARGLIALAGAPPDGEVRLAHPLYGETIRAGLGSLRAREIRLALVATLRARPQLTPEAALRVARWLLDAGGAIPTPLLIDAARAANLAGDPALGTELAAAARQAGAGIDAALLLARGHAIRSHFEDAEAVLADLEAELASEEQAVDYLQQQIAVLSLGLQRPEALRALLERAQTWWPGDGWQRRLEPLRNHVAAVTGQYGIRVAESAAALADPELDAETRRQLEPVHCGNLFWCGRTREAFELARLIRPEGPMRDLSDETALALWITISIECGYALAEFDQWLAKTIVRSVRTGDHAGAGFAALGLGRIRLLGGRLVDARRWLLEAELNFERHDAFGMLPNARALQVCVAAAARDADGASAALERCRAALAGSEALPYHPPYIARAEAWTKHTVGDRAGAQKLLLHAAEQAAWMPVYAADVTYDALLAGASARGTAEQLRTLRGRTDAPLVAAYAVHAGARADRDGAALMEVAGEFERIGAILYATEAAADAARAFLAAGRQDSARRAAARTRELFAFGQGGVAPTIEGLDSIAVELTAREAQLVELAKRGLSNAQIAEQLVLSIRTVESHLYRAMHKLGVSDRRELRR